MGDDSDFFAVPPQSSEDGGDGGAAPILLGDDGAPPLAAAGDNYDAFASPPLVLVPEPGDEGAMTDNDPTYLGEVNETPDDAPIIMGMEDPNTAGKTDGETAAEEPAPPAEPTGPTPMQIWNDEWQETLKQRKEVENSRRAELVEAARVALEEFAAGREVKRQTKMTTNRQEEQAKLEAIEADLENDNSWQRVCKMIEFTHDSTKAAADIKRMRDILIALKNDPSKATTLSN